MPTTNDEYRLLSCHLGSCFPLPFLLEIWLYGLYCVLFSIALFILLKRKSNGYKWHVAVMNILFGCTTIHVALFAAIFLHRGPSTLSDLDTRTTYAYLLTYFQPLVATASNRLEVTHNALILANKVFYIISSMTADAFIIYRCYVVWGHSKRVIALPLVALFISFFFHIFYIPRTRTPTVALVSSLGFAISSVVTNALATGLTAGRIWWIGHKARQVTHRGNRRQYWNTTAIVLESGIVYPVFLLLSIIFFFAYGSDFTYVPFAFVYQFVGIAPSLIIVRVGLGVSTNDVATTVQAIKAPGRGWPYPPGTQDEHHEDAQNGVDPYDIEHSYLPRERKELEDYRLHQEHQRRLADITDLIQDGLGQPPAFRTRDEPEPTHSGSEPSETSGSNSALFQPIRPPSPIVPATSHPAAIAPFPVDVISTGRRQKELPY